MGYVTSYVEKKVTQFAREHKLTLWIDPENHFAQVAQDLEQKYQEDLLAIPTFRFTGSFLELMETCQQPLSGKLSLPAIVHIPYILESDIHQTPLYEMYCAGQRLHLKLDQVFRDCAQGNLTPGQIESFLTSSPLTLETMDQLFAQHGSVPQELTPLLNKYGATGFIRTFLGSPSKIYQATTLGPGAPEKTAVPILWTYFHKQLGIPTQWPGLWLSPEAQIDQADALSKLLPEDLPEVLASWLFCSEYVQDLTIEPPSNRLVLVKQTSIHYQKVIFDCLAELRNQDPQLFIKLSMEIQNGLTEKEQSLDYQVMGTIDTFRFEADLFLKEALDRLMEGRWDQVQQLAKYRLPNQTTDHPAGSFWLTHDRERQWLWDWIDLASKLGSAMASHTPPQSQDQKQQVSWYLEQGWQIDQLHRKFLVTSEKFSSSASTFSITKFYEIRSQLGKLYRDTLNHQHRAWSQACEAKGFAGPGIKRQRDFYSQYLEEPMKKGQRVAVLLIDALRYELAQELASLLAHDGWQRSKLDYQMAELPTITAVGMNVLFTPQSTTPITPLLNDKNLIRGLQVGTRTITTAESRLALLKDASGRADSQWWKLEELLKAHPKERKRLKACTTLVVATREIDEMGESGVISYGLDHFQRNLSNIKEALLLLKELGFDQSIITADHGFLFSDEWVERGIASRLSHTDRRYAIDTQRSGDNLVSTSFESLGYQWNTSEHLIFARDTSLLKTTSNTGFYHGGNSLQERVVPVLRLEQTTTSNQSGLTYIINTKRLKPKMGYHQILLSVEATELFALESIELRLKGDEDVEVNIGDAEDALVSGDIIRVEPQRSYEILFKLKGSAARSRVHLVPMKSQITLQDPITQDYFQVDRSVDKDSTNAPGTSPTGKLDGQSEPVAPETTIPLDRIPSEYHAAIKHLERHGSLNEQFLVNTLGGGSAGARKARRFAISIEQWDDYLPFKVIVEQSTEGKLYRRVD